MRKILYKIFMVILLLAGADKISAQDARVNAVLDSSKIRIGEQVKLDIYLNLNAGRSISVEWPEIGDTLTGKIEVISVSPIDTTFPDKSNHVNMLQHQQIIVSAYDSGFFAIPGFKFVFNKDSNSVLYTQPLFLEVHTVPTDTSATKTKDIKPPFGEAFNWKWYVNYIYFGGGALLLIALIIILTVYYTRKNRQVVLEPEKPKIPAHITALSSLERIKEEQVWKEEKVKEYYSSISDAIRLYIEERFQVNALESTTDEIMLAFRSQVIDRDSKDKLQQLLMLSDLVKFAKQFPIENEHVFTLQNAFDFVNGTKREEEMTIPADAAVNDGTVSNASVIRPPQPVFPPIQHTREPVKVAGNNPGVTRSPEIIENTPLNKRKGFRNWTPKKIILFVVVFSLSYFAGSYVVRTFVLKPSIEKTMAVVSAQVNKGCPMKIDEETQLDSTSVSGKTFQYNYSLVRLSADQINVDNVRQVLEPSIIKEVRTNVLFKELRRHDVIFQYSYWDKAGVFLFSIKVSPEDYKN